MGQLVTVREAAHALNISENFLYVNIKRLPHMRLSSRAIRFDLDELKAWFREQAKVGR